MSRGGSPPPLCAEGGRSQKTASAGTQPGVLKDPAPQVRAATVGYVAAPVPSLAVPLLAGAAGEVVDSSSLRFLTAAALRQRQMEEEEEGAGEGEGEDGAGEGASAAGKCAVVQGAGERRKRSFPRTSSLSSPRRRLRQWHMQGSFCWFRSYAVSPSFVGRPKLPGFMDGMDNMDSFIALAVVSGSGLCGAGFAGIVPRAVFLYVVVRPQMLVIMAGMDQKAENCGGPAVAVHQGR